ncbi:hypothetical protein GCM10010507_41710 [Streptomyces cinnamoneus]|uniref:Uncharacterized protein n=1 Tax=Streptomyces cinnamoneus TaxID=53446 RepID=A0A918TRV7_STRCJ|nr:hypothetical protein GCM10010507_41710 [Streptomyces cinnamoneus]
MINGLPSAAGTTSPGSHPTSYRLGGSLRQAARIIREGSGGFPEVGVQTAARGAAASRVGDVIVPLHHFRTSYENDDRGCWNPTHPCCSRKATREKEYEDRDR